MDEIEDMIRQRYVPAPRSNLAERIIEASRHHEQQGQAGFGLWFLSFRDAFLLPGPAYALMFFLVLGGCLGYVGDFSSYLDTGAALSDYMFTADTLDVQEGEWL